nr:LuxR C-terminal-related transcriptional regulator [Agromyces ramosus]
MIVRGAAGGGKSTLLASWAKRHPRSGVWIGLDRSASDRLGFWRRVVDGVLDARLVPDSSVLHELVVSMEVDGRLRTLLGRGLSSATEPITVVLDDFHEVSDESVHEDIHWLLESGVTVQFVIATRTVSLLERPDRMARVDTALIRPSALAFRRDEVTAAAQLFQAKEAAEEVHRAFAGWPLPTRAALIQLRDGTAATVEEAIERVRDVGGSFVVDLVDDTGYGNFLLRTSVARRLSRELTIEVGGPDAEAHLARAEHEGLGSWSEGTSRGEFMLHPYLRERLEQKFVVRLPEQVADVRRAYARERAERGDALEAARQYVAIGDIAALVRLVRKNYAELVRARDAFSAILDSVDESELRRHPELLVYQLVSSHSDARVRRPGLARMVSLTTATLYARLGGGEPADRVSLLLALLAVQRMGGHFEQATKTAERLVSALGLLDEGNREELRGVIPWAWTQLATTFIYDEQLARAEECLQIALDVADGPWARVHTESLQGLITAMRGDLTTLQPRLAAARHRRGPAGWRGTFTAAGYHLAEAYEALERFDGGAARQQLDELAPHEPTIELWPLIARMRGLAALVDGVPYLGLQTLAADIAAHADRPSISRAMTTLLATTRAELLLADGQAHRAAEVLRPLRRMPTADLMRARVHLVLGDDGAALGYAAPVAWSEENIPRAKAEALLVVAAASHRLNQTADARDAAERAVALLGRFSLHRPLMTLPRRDLVAVLDAAGIAHEHLLEGVPNIFPPSRRDWSLTAAELRVLAMLEGTSRIDELAAQLGVSANTVKSHLRQIYRKLGVRSRNEALGVAGLHGMTADRDQPSD